MKIRQVLEERIKRGHPAIYAIEPAATIREAAIQMNRLHIGAMLVNKENQTDEYAGIITERDVLAACARYDDLDRACVNAAMTTNMKAVDANETVLPVVQLMTRLHIRHVPITENNKIIGLISVRDLMHCLDEEKDITINELSDYIISGSHNQVYQRRRNLAAKAPSWSAAGEKG
eukprot:TRINITY_DN16835_c0_g1_i2.p1 TRINITY_DN16835_c0_g1~~TRINITY_DN16835_c0_g1_i2.p1  ORF type:complete len:175 (+),score=20.57 TRINITY_DN16835_c0_g1_i2:70-594(+)